MAPVLESNNDTRKCSNTSQCPGKESSCEFNSWRNLYQCCKNVTFSCPPSEKALIDPKNSKPTQCLNNQTCPDGANCRGGICCSVIGRCPDGYVSAAEAAAMNFAKAGPDTCDLGKQSNTCSAPAVCLRAVDAPRPQFLCCIPIPQCPFTSELPFLDKGKPKICSDTFSTTQCPAGHQCSESTLPSIKICCSSVARMPPAPIGVPVGPIPSSPLQVVTVGPAPPSPFQDLTCPAKYEIQKHGAVTCDPAVTSSCLSGNRCLPSNKPGYFVCCTPISPLTDAKCTPGNFLFLDSNS